MIMKRHRHPGFHKPRVMYRACRGCKARFRLGDLGGFYGHIARCPFYKERYGTGIAELEEKV